jgi:hypothetical protein
LSEVWLLNFLRWIKSITWWRVKSWFIAIWYIIACDGDMLHGKVKTQKMLRQKSLCFPLWSSIFSEFLHSYTELYIAMNTSCFLPGLICARLRSVFAAYASGAWVELMSVLFPFLDGNLHGSGIRQGSTHILSQS